MEKISYLVKGQREYKTVSLDHFPDTCPFCKKGIASEFVAAFRENEEILTTLQTAFRCPIASCNRLFISYYVHNIAPNPLSMPSGIVFSFKNTLSLNTAEKRYFEQNIQELSKDFVDIYNQSFAAEQFELDLICGAGYRKSLEFLIKDYLKKIHPDDSVTIEKMFLKNCIDEFVGDTRIKGMAVRATWLGNDETHYQKKHTAMDLRDLKTLIDLTVHWISMELLTYEYEMKLPE